MAAPEKPAQNNAQLVCEIGRELGLNFTENNACTMMLLLESGMPPDNLVSLLKAVEGEIAKYTAEGERE